MQKCGLAVFIQGNHGWYAGPAPLRVPDLAICFGVVDIDRRLQDVSVRVANDIRFQVNFHVREIILPLIRRQTIIARIEKPLRVG